MMLVSWHCSALNVGHKEAFTQMKKVMDVLEPVLLIGDRCKFVLDKIDNVFKNEIHNCCNSFQSITQPLLSKDQLNSLVATCKNELPHQHPLTKEMFGFDLK